MKLLFNVSVLLQRFRALAVVVMLSLSFLSAGAQNITRFEYFIDNDPDFGAATIVTPPQAPVVTDFNISIPTNSLTKGFHTVYVRGQNTTGQWTPTIFYDFYIVTPLAGPGLLSKVEYFVDVDPGLDAATAVTGFTPTSSVSNLAINVNASSLAPGFHTFYVRTKTDDGQWSETTFSTFYVAKVSPPANVVKFEYFFDTDPGFDNGLASPVAPPSPSVLNQNIFAVPSSLSVGPHTINVRAKDSNGEWTGIISQTFSVTAPSGCGPGAPVVMDGSGCANTAIALTALGATGIQEYRWYDVATGGISLSSQSVYAPVVAATTTYYVSIYNTASGCEGPRSAVTATTATPPAKPSINAGGPTSFCPGGSVNLSAPPGFTSYLWSDSNTNATRTIMTASTLTLQVKDPFGCQSVASDPITTIVLTPPVKPTISGSPDICNGQSAALSGPAGFSYSWSDGETTQAISVSQTENITLIVKDANGCASNASDPVAVGCTNFPPVIVTTTITTYVDGTVSFSLLPIISDPDKNLDLKTLKITAQPASGALATIDNNENLNINYKGVSFAGTDHLAISVCDLSAACTASEIAVEVAGDITVFNGVSNNGDHKNDIFMIQYIDLLPDTKENKVTIFNRWGDAVFEVTDYNNTTNVFRGISNSGDALPAGTYFYRIIFASGKKEKTGYLSLKK